MIDLLAYSAPIITVGAIAALILPNQAAAVVSAQAGFPAMEVLGCAIGSLLKRDGGDE
jgi:hypothetical protein